jgi:hypothetical protein
MPFKHCAFVVQDVTPPADEPQPSGETTATERNAKRGYPTDRIRAG